MGMMNLAYFRDEDANKIDNIFEECDEQSHAQHGMHMVFNSFEAFKDASCPHERRLYASFKDQELSGRLHVTRPHHTSYSGLIILTSDYMLETLWTFPEGLEGDDLVNHLASECRKEIMRQRHLIGRDHPLVTKKRILTFNSGANKALPEQAVPGEDLGHLSSVNFDVLHAYASDDNSPVPQTISELYQNLKDDVVGDSDPCPIVMRIRGDRLAYQQALHHWVSLDQDDVAIIRYEHLLPAEVVKLTRTRRTPAEELFRKIEATEGDPIFMDHFVLLQEFFASQDISITL